MAGQRRDSKRYRERHAEELRQGARSRYQSEPRVREQSKERNYRWRAGDGREKYLEGKARENERRAVKAGRAYRPGCPGRPRRLKSEEAHEAAADNEHSVS